MLDLSLFKIILGKSNNSWRTIDLLTLLSSSWLFAIKVFVDLFCCRNVRIFLLSLFALFICEILCESSSRNFLASYWPNSWGSSGCHSVKNVLVKRWLEFHSTWIGLLVAAQKTMKSIFQFQTRKLCRTCDARCSHFWYRRARRRRRMVKKTRQQVCWDDKLTVKNASSQVNRENCSSFKSSRKILKLFSFDNNFHSTFVLRIISLNCSSCSSIICYLRHRKVFNFARIYELLQNPLKARETKEDNDAITEWFIAYVWERQAELALSARKLNWLHSVGAHDGFVLYSPIKLEREFYDSDHVAVISQLHLPLFCCNFYHHLWRCRKIFPASLELLMELCCFMWSFFLRRGVI